MSRIAAVFDTQRKALITYVTGGDTDMTTSAAVLRSLAEAGADIIEVGVPFSDPVADGPVIQRASARALAAGGSLASTLMLIEAARSDVAVPIVLFSYLNPILRMGTDVFIQRAARAGVAGVLVLDLPIEESRSMQGKLVEQGIDLIFLVSPTTSDQRLRAAAAAGSGFLYAISTLGVTGARAVVAQSAAALVQRIRSISAVPVAVGFGVSTPAQAREVTGYADGVVVGSAIVKIMEETARQGGDVAAEVNAFVRNLKQAMV